MRFFEDIEGERERIERAIRKFGYAAEHNFDWYRFYCEKGNKNIFVETDRGSLFTTYDPHKNVYWVVFDPLALPGDRAPLVAHYVEWVFKNTGAKKVWMQIEESTRRDLLGLLPEFVRANRPYFTLSWPVQDLRDFDTTLPGGHFKTIRKEMHRFYREHVVTVEDAKTYGDRKALLAIVDDWVTKRPNRDSIAADQYYNIIEGNFAGTKEARVLLLDGAPAGINAGWMIPNMNRYYGAVGVHNYAVDELGAMLYLEDLIWLKTHGYHEVDMGGSEPKLLAFKKKFLPKSFYKTFTFSVVRRSP